MANPIYPELPTYTEHGPPGQPPDSGLILLEYPDWDPQSPQKRTKKRWIIGIAASVIAIAAIVGGVVGGLKTRSKGNDNKPVATPPPDRYSKPTMTGTAQTMAETAYAYPAVVTYPRLQIFCVGPDRHIYSDYNVSTPELGASIFHGTFDHLGGIVSTSAPHISVLSSGWWDVFVIGTDNSLFHKRWTLSYGWQPSVLGYDWLRGKLLSSPAAVSWSLDRWDVFAIGTDGALWQIYNISSTGFQSEWGKINGDRVYVGDPSPTAVSWGEGRVDVFLVTRERILRTLYWDSANGSMWQEADLGGDCTSRVAAVSPKYGRIDLVVRGGDGGLWHKYIDKGTWSVWNSVSGSVKIQAEPDIISWGSDRLDAFAWGEADRALLHYSYDGKNWSEVENLGGDISGPPKAGSHLDRTGRFSVFAYGRYGDVLYKTWNQDAKTWYPEGFVSLRKPGNK